MATQFTDEVGVQTTFEDNETGFANNVTYDDPYTAYDDANVNYGFDSNDFIIDELV